MHTEEDITRNTPVCLDHRCDANSNPTITGILAIQDGVFDTDRLLLDHEVGLYNAYPKRRATTAHPRKLHSAPVIPSHDLLQVRSTYYYHFSRVKSYYY